MPTIDPLREELNKRRTDKERLDRQLFLGKERIKQIDARQARLDRYFNPEDQQHLAARRRLEAEKQRLRASLEQTGAVYSEALEAANTAWTAFLDMTDPREHLRQLDDHYPILMFPLRIETRFKTVGDGQDELWVRVFPDTCAVDTFEKALSDSEVKSAQDFYTAWWIAAGDDNGRRGAWRSLVAAHGVGRAQYIVDQYKPANPDDEPSPPEDAPESPVFLIIPETEPLPAAQKTSLSTFWEATWRGKGDAAALAEALSILQDAVGEDLAQRLIEGYPPANMDEDRPDRSAAEVQVVWLRFPDEAELERQQLSWSNPPTVRMMPERLVLLGYRGGTQEEHLEINELGNPIPFPLIVGPNPLAEEDEQIKIQDGEIEVSAGMRWMVDFEEAVKTGMAFRIPLTESQKEEGFDRLIVAGVQLSADQEWGRSAFQELIRHHYFGNAGFSFLPVGTPTNNTLDSKSGYSDTDDAEASYEMVFHPEEEEADPEVQSWWTKSDRTWFAEMLGLSEEETFRNTINTDGRDQCEVRAMNTALWPATWGYFFESMMRPLLDDQQIEWLRWYFVHFVVGRGAIPSIRVGDQPYGILPATVFSRMNWLDDEAITPPAFIDAPEGIARFLPQLNRIFRVIQEDWETMSREAAHVGKEGDPHQLLLDIVGLHGGSVEFHNRFAESINYLFNLYNIAKAKKKSKTIISADRLFSRSSPFLPDEEAVTFEQVVKAILNKITGRTLLRKLGYEGEEMPELLEKFFVLKPDLLDGPLIDDRPLSEEQPIRSYTGPPDEKNYIQWLIDAAESSLETLRKEAGFENDERPDALLYLMLKHALELGYWETSLRLYHHFELLDDQQLSMAKIEPDFIHIRPLQDEAEGNNNPENELLSNKPLDFPFASESKYHLLYQPQPAITNDESLPVANYVPQILKTHFASRYLWDQIKALHHLADAPTARLERAFVEHIDCASYRFDAWKAGLVHYQLAAMRFRDEREGDPSRPSTKEGTYIGAYGWLENVRTEDKNLIKVEDLSAELAAIFGQSDENPIVRDDQNAGYIQAPSLTHAVTAAILRNAYLSNADEDHPDIFGINLSSERVRLALSVLEGIRNGQSLPALLGYYFERGLHDRHAEAEVDQYIFKLRRKFPLVSNQMKSTRVADDEEVSIEALEARNVVHGINLIQYVEARLGPAGEPDYFDDLEGEGIDIPAAARTIIEEEINAIRDINDSVADLGLAESVHQVVQGNIDRAAGTLDTYSKGNYPQVPEVVQTPRSGVNITHRIGIHIDPHASPSVEGYTPRAMTEPGLNSLLRDLLPGLSDIFCLTEFFHQATHTMVTDFTVRMTDLGLQPIDLIYLLNTETDQAMSALDDLVIHYIRTPSPDNPNPPRLDAEIKIRYYHKREGEVSLFEIAPLIRHLRALLLKSRPLRPGDVALSSEATDQADQKVSLDKQRLAELQAALQSSKTSLDNHVEKWQLFLDANGENETAVAQEIDNQLEELAGILSPLSLTGLPQTGTGPLHAWRQEQLAQLLEQVDVLMDRWEEKSQRFDELIDDFNSAPPETSDEDKIDILIRAERQVTTQPTADPGTDPIAFKAIVDGKKAGFDGKKLTFETFYNTDWQKLSLALQEGDAVLDYEAFDLVPTDLSSIKSTVLAFAHGMLNKATLIQADLQKRLDEAGDLLTSHDTEADPGKRIELLQNAASLLLSEDFVLVPSFTLPAERADEWQKSLEHQTELLSYQTDTLNNLLPVDDWIYGVARVREKMWHLEQATILMEGFNTLEVELTPVQLPYREPYRWFAMEFGADDEETEKALQKVFLENDHLLYTAYYHQPPSPGQPQCGLLLDEWTEVIPTERETAGMTFHYDRPNSEPPQTLLLVTPPQFQDSWSWKDLIDALHETLDEAKLRVVEPQQIDKAGSGYANFLPATISMVTKYPISMMLNYGWNNQLFNFFQNEDNE